MSRDANKLSRRDLFKLGATGAGAMALGAPALKLRNEWRTLTYYLALFGGLVTMVRTQPVLRLTQA